MKTLLLSSALVVMTSVANAQAVMAKECVSILSPSLEKAACLHLPEFPGDARNLRVVSTVTVDPKRVAAMPPLPQVDTVIREMAVAK